MQNKSMSMASRSTRSSIRSTTRLNGRLNVLRGNSSIINKTPQSSQGKKHNAASLSSPPTKPSRQANVLEESRARAGRPKRRRDTEDELNQSPVRKQTRIAVEIGHGAESKVNRPETKINGGIPPALSQYGAMETVVSAAETAPQPATELGLENWKLHHDNVANGIKHRLDRINLYGEEATSADEGRKLRSREGTRFKSDLALYFPEYDEIIGNEPKEEHILNIDTPIILIDTSRITKQPTTRNGSKPCSYPIKAISDALFDQLHDAERVKFTPEEEMCEDMGVEDPLAESHFEIIHRRPERSEKAIRNGDKGRAQHERDQVIRLLEALQGSDWLKVMGVSGITESRKRDFEPARIHFIRGCQTIIEKFRTWREEEKRRKLEKDNAEAEAAAQAEDSEDEEDTVTGDVLSDVDASAARQLLEEATARSSQPSRKGTWRRSQQVTSLSRPQPEPEKEFKSFFEKPHEREAALRQHRRSGRKVIAWGRLIPDFLQQDFDLPEFYRDKETLRAQARRQRKAQREAKGKEFV